MSSFWWPVLDAIRHEHTVTIADAPLFQEGWLQWQAMAKSSQLVMLTITACHFCKTRRTVVWEIQQAMIEALGGVAHENCAQSGLAQCVAQGVPLPAALATNRSNGQSMAPNNCKGPSSWPFPTQAEVDAQEPPTFCTWHPCILTKANRQSFPDQPFYDGSALSRF